MHKIALEPKELYKLWGEGKSAGVEESDQKCRDHAYAPLHILFLDRAVPQLAGGS